MATIDPWVRDSQRVRMGKLFAMLKTTTMTVDSALVDCYPARITPAMFDAFYSSPITVYIESSDALGAEDVGDRVANAPLQA